MYWIIFHTDQLLLHDGALPGGEEPPVAIPEGTHVHTLPDLDGEPCLAFCISYEEIKGDKGRYRSALGEIKADSFSEVQESGSSDNSFSEECRRQECRSSDNSFDSEKQKESASSALSASEKLEEGDTMQAAHLAFISLESEANISANLPLSPKEFSPSCTP